LEIRWSRAMNTGNHCDGRRYAAKTVSARSGW
jgi:hypothetical protein